MSLDAVVIRDMVEEPLLDVPMRITSTGILYVKGQFIEETRSYEPTFPPIPAPVDSMSYDDFNSYDAFLDLNGLNSGSNEWDNTTPLAAYVAGVNYASITNLDYFNEYNPHTSLYQTMSGGGEGGWSGSYDYYGITNYTNIRAIDEFEEYTVDTPISESNLGRGDQAYPAWSGSWSGVTFYERVLAWDDFETYTVDTLLSGSNDQQDPRYQEFTGAWLGVNFYEGIYVYDNFSTYETGSNVSGSDDNPDSRYVGFSGPWIARAPQWIGIKPYEDFNSYTIGENIEGLDYTSSIYPYWTGPWVVRLDVSGSI
jgi:hypothetical protein